MRFHHVGLATEDLEATCDALQQRWNARPLSPVVLDDQQKVRLMLVNVGGQVVELVEDQGDGPVAAWLNRGARVYHMCFEVEDLGQALDDSRSQGSVIASPPKPAVLFSGRQVAFLLDRSLGLVELLEKENC